VFIAQGGTLILTGTTTSYANILNLGQVIQEPGSTLIMVDASVLNQGHWTMSAGTTTITSNSLIYTDNTRYGSWYQNAGGIFESQGSPLIGINFNNTGGIMLANVDSTGCPDSGPVIGGFTFTSNSYRQIFYLSSFVAEDRVNIFNYNSFYNRAPYHYPSPDPYNPTGCYGVRFDNIIQLPQAFNPTQNGYFTGDSTYGQYGGAPWVFVTYTYNGFRNFVPDGPELGSSALPRLIVVTDDQNPTTFSRFLTLTADSPHLISSVTLLASLILAILIFF